jgi:hypothetical protein
MQRVCAIGLPLLFTCTLVVGQEEGVLLSADFEEEIAPFITIDPEADLSISHEPDVAYKGEGCLELTYLQRAIDPPGAESGLPGTIALPLPQPQAELRGVSLALSCRLSAPVAVMLSEGEGGPRYMRLVWCEAGEWHEFSIPLDEFQRDVEGPADPDGKPTPENINAVVIVDVNCFFLSLAEQAALFHVDPPAHQVLRMDEFRLLSSAPKAKAAEEDRVVIADYEPPLRGVAMLGGQDVAVWAEKAGDDGNALNVDYKAPARTLLALLHQVQPGSLVGIAALEFKVKSSSPATLIVNLEEKRGPGEKNKCNYSARVTVEPKDDWETVTIPITGLTLGADDADPNSRLDLEHVSMIMIADASALIEGADIWNTLSLDNLVGVK